MQDDTRSQIPALLLEFHDKNTNKASASNVTPVGGGGGGQPPDPPDGWKIAAVAAGGVAAVTGAPIIATAAIVGGVVWAIESSKKE